MSGTEYAVKVSECYNARAVEEVRKHEALANHPHCVQFYKGWEEGLVDIKQVIFYIFTLIYCLLFSLYICTFVR